jgi:hypothetical protein
VGEDEEREMRENEEMRPEFEELWKEIDKPE